MVGEILILRWLATLITAQLPSITAMLCPLLPACLEMCRPDITVFVVRLSVNGAKNLWLSQPSLFGCLEKRFVFKELKDIYIVDVLLF